MPQDDPLGSDDAGAADQRARRRRGGASASGSGDGGGGDADSGGGAESGGGDKAELQLRKYWAPPQLLLDWQDEQEDRNSTWTELFFDLFLVAAVSAVLHIFVGDPTWRGAGRYLLYLGLFHFTWTSSTHLMTRVHMGGLAFDVLRLLRHVGVLGMTLAAQDFGGYALLFAGSYLLVRLLSLATFVMLGMAVPRARSYAAVCGGLHSLMAALAVVDIWQLATGALPNPLAAHTALFGAALFLEAAAPAVITAVPSAHLPLHVEHVDERLGLLQIIYLGESIVALGTTALAGDCPVLQILGIALGAVVVWTLFMSIYHVEADQHQHAMRQGKLRGLVFQYLHFLLGCAINTSGAGLLMALESYTGGTQGESSHHQGGEYHPHVAWTLCVCYGAALHLIAAVRATHYVAPGARRRGKRPRSQLGAAQMVAADVIKGLPGDPGVEDRVQHRLDSWLIFAVLWPILAYVLPLMANPPGQSGRLRTTGLLGCLATHAVIYIVVETGITHSVVAEVEGAAGDAEEGGGAGGGAEAPAGAPDEARAGLDGPAHEQARGLMAGMEAPTA